MKIYLSHIKLTLNLKLNPKEIEFVLLIIEWINAGINVLVYYNTLRINIY